MLRRIRYTLLALVYPRGCAVCRSRLARDELAICPYCALRLRHYEPMTMRGEERLYSSPTFRHFYSLYAYERGDAVQRMIYALKYEGFTEVATLIARTAYASFGAIWAETKYDLILAVPLEPTRLVRRGYNQSFLMAQELAQLLGCKASESIITRRSGSHSQTRLNRGERIANTSKVFRLSSPQVGSSLQGKRILVIDDVLTTGSTLLGVCQILEESHVDLIDIFTSSTAI